MLFRLHIFNTYESQTNIMFRHTWFPHYWLTFTPSHRSPRPWLLSLHLLPRVTAGVPHPCWGWSAPRRVSTTSPDPHLCPGHCLWSGRLLGASEDELRLTTHVRAPAPRAVYGRVVPRVLPAALRCCGAAERCVAVTLDAVILHSPPLYCVTLHTQKSSYMYEICVVPHSCFSVAPTYNLVLH